jgi:hypothetical protein
MTSSHRIVFTRHAEDMLVERKIERRWVESAVNAPEALESDPKRPETFSAIRQIPEHGGRYLRVVYTLAGGTIKIVTAYFDRRHRR